MITVSISIVGIDSANSKNKKLQLNFLQFIKIQKVLVLKKIKHLLGLLLIYENMLIEKMWIKIHKRLSFSCLLWTYSMQHYSIDGNKPR